MSETRKYRIISFDGGGVRGVFAARLIERLSAEHPDLVEATDLYAGTSTGAILAAGLAGGYEPATLTNLYLHDSARVFKDSLLDDVRDLGKLRGAEYSSAPFRRVLKKHFGDATLADLNQSVLIPAFDLDNEQADPELRTWKPKFFHNLPNTESDGGQLVVDVIMRSCAAPTYFPSYQGYIDGGVTANNPSMTAVAQAIGTTDHQLKDIRLLSLGTGRNLEYIGGKRHDWGLLQWSPFLLRLLSASSTGVVEYECRQLLSDNYHRLSTIYPKRIPLDAIDQIDEIISIADSLDLTPTLAWLNERW